MTIFLLKIVCYVKKEEDKCKISIFANLLKLGPFWFLVLGIFYFILFFVNFIKCVCIFFSLFVSFVLLFILVVCTDKF